MHKGKYRYETAGGRFRMNFSWQKQIQNQSTLEQCPLLFYASMNHSKKWTINPRQNIPIVCEEEISPKSDMESLAL